MAAASRQISRFMFTTRSTDEGQVGGVSLGAELVLLKCSAWPRRNKNGTSGNRENGPGLFPPGIDFRLPRSLSDAGDVSFISHLSLNMS